MIACRYIRFFYRYVEFFLLFLLYFIRILDITISCINILNCLDSLTFIKTIYRIKYLSRKRILNVTENMFVNIVIKQSHVFLQVL